MRATNIRTFTGKQLLRSSRFNRRRGIPTRSTNDKKGLVSALGGPYFDFLVVTPDEYRKDRRGGIKSEYFRHPDALRVTDCVVSIAVSGFSKAHPKFNYYGATEFGGEALDRLIQELDGLVTVIRNCVWKWEFGTLVSGLFVWTCTYETGPWRRYWPRIREEVVGAISMIAEQAKSAKRTGKVLLVMGI